MSNNRYNLPCPSEDSRYIASQDPPFLHRLLSYAEQTAPLDARLLYITNAKYERDWHSNAHSHNFSELFYVTGGAGRFMTRAMEFPLQENDLVIINPHVEHTEYSSETNPLEYIVLGVDGLLFTNPDSQRQDFSVLHIPPTGSEIPRYMELLLSEVQHNHIGQDVVCQSLLNILLIQILRNQEVKISNAAAVNVSAECNLVKAYIDTHFKEPLTLEELARQAHQNKYYVSHAFKEAFGMSPIQYLMYRMVEESKYLLADTNSPVAEISFIAGFSSPSHFSQAFRRLEGVTPNEYRKATRKAKFGKKR